MGNSAEKKTLVCLAVAFFFLAISTLLSMMGFGQYHGDHWLETRQTAVKELQTLGNAYSMVLLNSQRYVASGEVQHLTLYKQAVDELKLHLTAIQSLENGQYGRSERVRRLSNEIAISLGEIELDVKLRLENKPNRGSTLLLTNREVTESEQIFKRIVNMEREEASAVQAFYSGDVKARGNSLPLISFVFACFSFVFALVELLGERRNLDFEEDSSSLAGAGNGSSAEGGHASLAGAGSGSLLSNAGGSNGLNLSGSSGSLGGADAGVASLVGHGSNNGNGSKASGNGAAPYRNGRLDINSEDITSLRRDLASALSQLEKLASADYLTDVLNVRGLEQVLRIEENRAGRSGEALIAMLINLDNLKKVNEGLGHTTGDVILKETAKRVLAILRPTDHVARVGGDEFLVLLPDTNMAYGMRVAERIRCEISDNPMKSTDDQVSVTASIGVVSLPARIASVQEAVNLTRSALRRSKEAGKNRVTVSEESSSQAEKVRGRSITQRDIVEQLLDVREFRTVYQPIIRLADEGTDGYEVLSRGPDGAFESPSDFFRICVENNILTTVDLQCLRLCLSNIPNVILPAVSHSNGDTSGKALNAKQTRFHINLFPSTLLETPVDKLLDLFPKDRPDIRFCIEISEQEFISEPAYLREHVSALKNAGVLVAVDDVGFGRSSLETLILLEPDLVKVDRKYVAGLSTEPAKARLLRRLANVAKSLGAQIIAEGIEDRADLPVLIEMGIDYGQGFLWGELLKALPDSASGSLVR
ncbi:MAG: EAL domain-containing protein [Candidatus Obscuribacter phosphatis]|uniref:EAL domain-containing protein n=1 Tax=Candidatus Obscuribacter phosphatis TaxID=1906157 RepID=A0A8J7PEF8_9BACT|nr:EAL domain-containing protein [Candidatus Obscuribacter phosphatis]